MTDDELRGRLERLLQESLISKAWIWQLHGMFFEYAERVARAEAQVEALRALLPFLLAKEELTQAESEALLQSTFEQSKQRLLAEHRKRMSQILESTPPIPEEPPNPASGRN